jgi:hypothetical protein
LAGKESSTSVSTIGASPEQKRYAAVLGVAMKIGLAAILVTFFLYVTGIIEPHVPLDKVSESWHLKGDAYLDKLDLEKGWSWVGRLGEGDFLNFAPIAFLASVTMICYLTIIPILLKNKDWLFAALAAAEVLILVLAASGIIPSGGH